MNDEVRTYWFGAPLFLRVDGLDIDTNDCILAILCSVDNNVSVALKPDVFDELGN